MEIVSLDDKIGQQRRLSSQQGIALTNEVNDLDGLDINDLMVQGFVFVYVESGRANFRVSGEEATVEAGEMLFVNFGQRFSDLMISTHIKFRAIFLNKEYMETLANKLAISWSIRSSLSYMKYVKVDLSDMEKRNICYYYDLLDEKRHQTRYQQQAIDALSEAFGYEMLDLVERHGMLDEKEEITTKEYRGAAHQHLDAFMNLLLCSDKVNHSVVWYAEQLHISSKYLVLVCQQVMGESPSALIQKEISQRAVRLLRETSLSIKQIAFQLGFSNQSHFGTYMRRVTGKGPQKWREEGIG